MPLTGEYEPSAASWARDQVDLYERSGGTQGADNQGHKVIILTSVGAKTGKIRKTPLMRVEHDGEYAVVASLGGAPEHPVWYYNLTANPHVELQDGPVKKDYQAREVHDADYAAWWERAALPRPMPRRSRVVTARRSWPWPTCAWSRPVPWANGSTAQAFPPTRRSPRTRNSMP